MSSNPSRLHDLLSAHLSETETAQIMATFEDVFRPHVATGGFDFSPFADESAVKRAVQLATGREVRQVIQLSVSNPFPKPAWVAERAYKTALSEIFEASFGPGTIISFLDDLDPGFLIFLCKDRWKGIWARLTDAVRDSFVTRLGTNLQPCFGSSVSGNMLNSAYRYVGLHLAGRGEEAERVFAPFIRVMAVNPVLCFKTDDRHAVIVLVP